MVAIDVDFDVFKELTIRRRSEEMTENEVLRELLGLCSAAPVVPTSSTKQAGVPWVVKGVSFPSGTEFRATYRGKQITATVQNGALVVNGKRYSSPSAAAVELTGTSVNGWRFWECLLPGTTKWKTITELRKN